MKFRPTETVARLPFLAHAWIPQCVTETYSRISDDHNVLPRCRVSSVSNFRHRCDGLLMLDRATWVAATGDRSVTSSPRRNYELRLSTADETVQHSGRPAES